MNTLQINKVLHKIYRDFTGEGRKMYYYDSEIKDFLINLYNKTELDFEEIKSLWIEYLTNGNLSISNAIKNARERIFIHADLNTTINYIMTR